MISCWYNSLYEIRKAGVLNEDVFIDDHALKHGIEQEDIEYAWEHFAALRHRGSPRDGEIVLVGPDRSGRPMQVIAVETSFGVLIYHALRPPQRSTLKELGIDVRGAIWHSRD